MKFCKDCAYFKPSNFCKHPQNGVNLVTGEASPFFATTCRRSATITGYVEERNSCGPAGTLWQPIPVEKPWYKFWS